MPHASFLAQYPGPTTPLAQDWAGEEATKLKGMLSHLGRLTKKTLESRRDKYDFIYFICIPEM